MLCASTHRLFQFSALPPHPPNPPTDDRRPSADRPSRPPRRNYETGDEGAAPPSPRSRELEPGPRVEGVEQLGPAPRSCSWSRRWSSVYGGSLSRFMHVACGGTAARFAMVRAQGRLSRRGPRCDTARATGREQAGAAAGGSRGAPRAVGRGEPGVDVRPCWLLDAGGREGGTRKKRTKASRGGSAADAAAAAASALQAGPRSLPAASLAADSQRRAWRRRRRRRFLCRAPPFPATILWFVGRRAPAAQARGGRSAGAAPEKEETSPAPSSAASPGAQVCMFVRVVKALQGSRGYL